MSVCLLRVGDGRDECHERSWDSLQANLPVVAHTITVDDREHKLGFAGAIEDGWNQVIVTGAEWVFHAEMDFLYHRPVALGRMIRVLKDHPYLAQICLKRQPVNAQEQAAGGIVERDPDSWRQRVEHGDIWTEGRVCFSTNPCVYSAALCRHGWPQVEHSEGIFSHLLMEDPDVRFAFWGPKFAEPAVEHIGERRGQGY